MKTDIYTVEQIAPNTWRIDECGRDNCYLLCGSERALLIDCSIGAGDLLATVRGLTDLPLTVAVTHAHGDHAGGGHQFGEILVPAAENGRLWRGQNLRVFRRKLLSNRMKKQGVRKRNIRGDLRETVWTSFEDGAAFDLGGRTVRTVPVPAHTIGSTVFFDDENKLAFLGDAVCPVLPMHTFLALPLAAFPPIGDRLYAMTEGYTLWCGHGDGRLDRDLIRRQTVWVREILSKNPANAERQSAAYYPAFDKTGCVGYNPGNLYETNEPLNWRREARRFLRG